MQSLRWGLIPAIAAAFISVTLGILFNVNPLHIFLRVLIFGVVSFGLGFGLRFIINSFLPEILYTDEEAASAGEQQGENVDITLDSTGEYAVPELYKSYDEEEMGNIEDLISGAFRPGYGSEQPGSKGKTGFAPSMTSDSVDDRANTGYNGMGFFNDLKVETPEAGDSPEGDLSSAFQGFTPLPIEDGDSFQAMSVFQKPEGASPVEKPAAGQEQFAPSFGEDDSGLGGLPDLDTMARAFSSFDAEPPPPVASAGGSAAPSSGLLAEESQPDRSQYKGNKPQTLQGDFQAKDIARGLSTLLSKEK
jgi:hypothetical protein